MSIRGLSNLDNVSYWNFIKHILQKSQSISLQLAPSYVLWIYPRQKAFWIFFWVFTKNPQIISLSISPYIPAKNHQNSSCIYSEFNSLHSLSKFFTNWQKNYSKLLHELFLDLLSGEIYWRNLQKIFKKYSMNSLHDSYQWRKKCVVS